MRHVVVTGGSSGLGAALVRHYLKRGDAVTCIARDRTRMNDLAVACNATTGRSPDLVACDVSDADAMRMELQRIDALRGVDILYANAGIGGRAVLSSPDGEDDSLARSVFGINTIGVVNTLTPLLAPMIERRKGHLVVVSSVAAFVPLAQSPAYSAAKAAARTYGHALRRLASPHGVRVTVVSPGFIDTPMSRSLPYVRPFLVDADVAAARIARAVDAGRAELILPWQFRLAVALHAILPNAISDRILAAADPGTKRRPPADS